MKPSHIDSCNHKRSEYVGTFFVGPDSNTSKSNHEGLKGRARDLYVFTDRNGNQEVCIRCGDEPDDYYSPGPLSEWVARCAFMDFDMYALAMQMLAENGKFKWEKK